MILEGLHIYLTLENAAALGNFLIPASALPTWVVIGVDGRAWEFPLRGDLLAVGGAPELVLQYQTEREPRDHISPWSLPAGVRLRLVGTEVRLNHEEADATDDGRRRFWSLDRGEVHSISVSIASVLTSLLRYEII